jgi:hypothetical protein
MNQSWLVLAQKKQNIGKNIWVDVRFPMKSSAKDSSGKIAIWINPTNQTIIIGKNL